MTERERGRERERERKVSCCWPVCVCDRMCVHVCLQGIFIFTNTATVSSDEPSSPLGLVASLLHSSYK